MYSNSYSPRKGPKAPPYACHPNVELESSPHLFPRICRGTLMVYIQRGSLSDVCGDGACVAKKAMSVLRLRSLEVCSSLWRLRRGSLLIGQYWYKDDILEVPSSTCTQTELYSTICPGINPLLRSRRAYRDKNVALRTTSRRYEAPSRMMEPNAGSEIRGAILRCTAHYGPWIDSRTDRHAVQERPFPRRPSVAARRARRLPVPSLVPGAYRGSVSPCFLSNSGVLGPEG
ncbi:hypothetical protein C8Q79DRAFT_746913 [Trametes meyenii]|nr:hypothetical protein C8Q79DRAFT_746913 [Trametes meyenii]